MNDQKTVTQTTPTPGVPIFRTVAYHFSCGSTAISPAIITNWNQDGTVDLCVLSRFHAVIFKDKVSFGTGQGQWSEVPIPAPVFPK